jgi:hypothetical protein
MTVSSAWEVSITTPFATGGEQNAAPESPAG